MDYVTAIERVYEHLENGHVDKAVMGCLRIARHLNDYLYIAIFLRQTHDNNRAEVLRIFYDDTTQLKDEARKLLWEKSLERWMASRTLDYSLGVDAKGKDINVLVLGAGELDSEFALFQHIIGDMSVSPKMGEYDAAAFTDRYDTTKAQLRLRMRGIVTIKERLRALCLNYAIRIERQLEGQQRTQSVLQQAQNEVSNYFKARSEDVYAKLQKATQLIDSDDPEDQSFLLTEVRRTIKSVADFFYPSQDQVVECSDGVKRTLGDEQYLNRLQEFLVAKFAKSSSRDLLVAEFEHLSVLVRRLNEVASKGVHSTVTRAEAKRGLISLYMFLNNVCSHLEENAA